MAAVIPGKVENEDMQNLIEHLQTYLKCQEDQDEVIDYAALQKIKDSNNAGPR